MKKVSLSPGSSSMNKNSHNVHNKMPKETSKHTDWTRRMPKAQNIHTSEASLGEITATKYPAPPPSQ